MAGDQNLVWAHGGSAAFSPPVPQPLQHCHSPASLYSNPLISGGFVSGSASLPPAAPTAPSLLDLQNELLAELLDLDDDLQIPGGDQCTYAPELGGVTYSSASATFDGQPENSSGSSATPLPDMAGFSPSMDGTLSGIPSTEQFHNPLLSSTPLSFYPSYYQEPGPYSAAPFTGSQAISGGGPTALPPAAGASYQSSDQEVFYYPSVNNSPPIISGGSTAPPVAAAAPPQADLDLSVMWTPEEQHLLNELYMRYGHIECPVSRFAKIARPFPGKRIRDVALRIKWMEEQSSQRAKTATSSRSNRSTRVPGKSKDLSRSQPGNPY